MFDYTTMPNAPSTAFDYTTMPNSPAQTAGGGLAGLLGDNAGGVQALAGNPLFNMGMGLLASRYDSSVNPFGAAIQGLKTAGEQQRTMDKEERAEDTRDLLTKYLAASEEDRRRLQAFMGNPQAIDPQAAAMQNLTQNNLVSPSVQRGLEMSPQNQELYNRMAWREVMGMM